MFSKTALAVGIFVAWTVAAVAPPLLPASAQGEGSSGATGAAAIGPIGALQPPDQATGPTPRRDLALGLGDLPPGYAEAASLDLMLFDTPLDDRVIRRSNPGAGPLWIWTMTFQPAAPVTQERLVFFTDDLSVFLMRATADVAQLSAWAITPSADLGDVAHAYTFKFHTYGDVEGDGVLALFGSPDYVTYMVVLNTDGQSVSDLRGLARIVTARVNADRATSAFGR